MIDQTAIEAARMIVECWHSKGPPNKALGNPQLAALTVARALLSLAATGQSATDAAREIAYCSCGRADGTEPERHSSDCPSQFRPAIAQAIAAYAAAQVAAEREACAAWHDEQALMYEKRSIAAEDDLHPSAVMRAHLDAERHRASAAAIRARQL